VVDKKFLAWIHTQYCAVWEHTPLDIAGCNRIRIVTAHHVRRLGEPKNDRRVLPLCVRHHLHDGGAFSIERLGKKKFEERYGIDLEKLIEFYNEQYRTLLIGGEKWQS
jgi:hypothetical protein